MWNVTDAKRELLIGSIAFIGASGSGKTLSMLKTAKGFMDKKYPGLTDSEKWAKVGVIDTEHSRAKIYAGTSNFGAQIGSFKHLDFPAPYTVDRLDEAIEYLKQTQKIEILIIDSTSHFWEGSGGLLDLQQDFGGNFQAWAKVNPFYDKFISLVTGEKHELDTLVGIRAKQHYEASTSDTGKLKIEKMGLKPIQRDSLEYEFHIVFNIDMDHIATAMKDNSGMYDGSPGMIETKDGENLYTWLKTGEDVKAKEKAEKKVVVDTILAFKESDMKGMEKYVDDLIQKVEKTFPSLYHLPLDRLHAFVTMVSKEEKRIRESNADGVKSLQEAAGIDKLLVKDLLEVAKTFNIEGTSKMNKDQLLDAIKKEQLK